MHIDATTAELFLWIALTVFLIFVPVILLFQQQLPYVLEVIDNLKNIGLPRLPSSGKIRNKIRGLKPHKAPLSTTPPETPIETTDPFDQQTQEQVLEEEMIEHTPPEAVFDTGEVGLVDLETPTQEGVESSDDNLTGKQQQDLESIKYAALSHKERGKMDLYEKKLIEGLAIDPHNSDLLRMLAEFYFNEGNFVKALTIFKKIINEEPDDHKTIRQIAQIYLQQNQPDTAQLLVEKAIQLKPDNPKYHITMVEIYYAGKQLRQAIKSMENVLKLRPTNKDYMLTLAGLHEEIGEPTKAKTYYTKILQIDPSNETAKRSLKRLSFK